MAASRRGEIIYGNVGVTYCKNKKSNPLLFLHAVIGARTLVSTDGERPLSAQHGQNKTSQSNKSKFLKKIEGKKFAFNDEYSRVFYLREYKALPAGVSLFWTEKTHCLACLTAFTAPKGKNIQDFVPHFKQSFYLLTTGTTQLQTFPSSIWLRLLKNKCLLDTFMFPTTCWSAVWGPVSDKHSQYFHFWCDRYQSA